MRLAIAQKHEKILVEQLKDCLSFDQNLRHFLHKAHNFPCEHLIKANDEISHDQYVVTHFRQRFLKPLFAIQSSKLVLHVLVKKR